MEDALVLEPRELFDAAIVGWVERCGQTPVVCYSREKLIEVLSRDGGSREDAQEYIDFNITGCWAGEGTWMVLNECSAEELQEMF